MLAFGQQVEKLISATITKLAAIKSINKMVLLALVRALINTQRTLKAVLIRKAIDQGLIFYKIFHYNTAKQSLLENLKFEGATSSSSQEPRISKTPLFTMGEPEMEVPPSPSIVEISKELFPEESLGKKMKTE